MEIDAVLSNISTTHLVSLGHETSISLSSATNAPRAAGWGNAEYIT